MGNPKFNASGCKDETAYQAIKNIDAEKRYKRLLETIFYISNLAGFHVNSVVLKDNRTGKIWR